MSFLAAYFDPALPIDGDTKPSDIAAAEVERLVRAVAVTRVALAWPRRLGADADAEELALDKKRARRVLHALEQSLEAWLETKGVDSKLAVDENEVRQEAAIVDWNVWGAALLEYYEARMRYVATWAMNVGEARFGKTALVRFNNERAWLTYALR